MRFISGIVVGVILVIGVAFIRDASIDTTGDHPARTVVNWDVASEAVRGASDWVREQAAWIGQQLHRPG